MHVLFVHQNFPAQFGHVAAHLARREGFRCTFVSERAEGVVNGIECVRYAATGGATPDTHYCSRSFENVVWHSHAVFRALERRPDVRPDLVVAHSGFLSATFLRELYDCPVVNYFEYFYHTVGSDMDFLPDFPATPLARLRARARNAALLLDLDSCDLGYAPTRWQHGLLPAEGPDDLRRGRHRVLAAPPRCPAGGRRPRRPGRRADRHVRVPRDGEHPRVRRVHAGGAGVV